LSQRVFLGAILHFLELLDKIPLPGMRNTKRKSFTFRMETGKSCGGGGRYYSQNLVRPYAKGELDLEKEKRVLLVGLNAGELK